MEIWLAEADSEENMDMIISNNACLHLLIQQIHF